MTREVTTEWKKSRLLKKPLTFSYRLPRDGLFFSVLKCCMMRWSLLPTAMCNSFLYSYTNVIAAFGGLGVACWPLVPTFAGWNPTEAVGFLRAKKILSMPSFGGEVKPSVPCRRFAACKRSLNGVEVVISAKLPDNILAHSSHFRRWDLSRRGGRGGTWWWKVGTSKKRGKAMANYP